MTAHAKSIKAIEEITSDSPRCVQKDRNPGRGNLPRCPRDHQRLREEKSGFCGLWTDCSEVDAGGEESDVWGAL